MGLLQYRIPGEETFFAKGEWELKTLASLLEGDFVLTTFNKEEVYVFKEEDGEKNYSFHPEEPYAVSEQEYYAGLSAFKSEFEERGIAKAIYSRIHKVVKSEDFNLEDAFNRLCEKYPNAFVYLISGEKTGTWMGATPETLVSSKKNAFYTMSLAGTKKSKELSWTQKEIEEQAFVTDFILEKLRKAEVSNLQSDGPKDIFTGAVYHLKTDITFSTPTENIKQLVEVLHPTPAVCGVPTDKALDLIAKHEKHSRGFYAGVIGRVGQERCDLFVNLRCMQVFENSLGLYVGGGITKDSVVEAEYQETINKAQTLLRVLV